MTNFNLASATLNKFSRDFTDAVGKIGTASTTHKIFLLVQTKGKRLERCEIGHYNYYDMISRSLQFGICLPSLRTASFRRSEATGVPASLKRAIGIAVKQSRESYAFVRF